ncbi:MAG: O-antigen ligase domain-containing protein, partial [Methylocapsa sp.]|nr:O-antigen ligase domain-containing protein [Methylocapsa sp.]
MILDTVLAFGLVLSELAQLRLSIVPLGPGELCLLIWCIAMLARAISQHPALKITPALSRLLVFWLLFVLAQ